ncbi:MAG: porin family protein [Cytophagales bacterium]|nr:porin family protein [Cytophagales bacterium]
MKIIFCIVTLYGLLAVTLPAKGQVLISLLFGKALNTPKIEFGLTGGLNRSYFNDVSSAEGLNNFNLGFYFHILLKNESYLSTGVLVKSNVGATGMPTYSLNNPEFDDIYKNGVLTTKVHYFYVPIMFHQRFNNRWFLEGGVQAGLRNKANDIFKEDFQGGDLEYAIDTKDDYKRLDAGLVGGMGYKFKKEIKSMSAGFLYYYGLVDITKDETLDIKNSSINFYIRIPIGVGKASTEK